MKYIKSSIQSDESIGLGITILGILVTLPALLIVGINELLEEGTPDSRTEV